MKKRRKMKLTDNEKRDILKLIQESKDLPEKYRFLLFKESRQIELNWNGKSEEITNIDLPFQIIERIDEPRTEKIKLAQGSLFGATKEIGWTNKLIWGDNKIILSSIKNGPLRNEIEKEGGIKLIYIDPPFDVGANFSMDIEIGDISYEKKPNVLEQIAYRDTWGLGSDSFLSMIYERLILMKDLLAEDGNIVVHCDQRLNHSIRHLMNEIFGIDNFRNEIIWQRTTAGKSVYNNLPKNVDYLLWYSKTNNYKFKTFMSELSKTNLKTFSNDDNDGRGKYSTFPLVSPNLRQNLKFEYIDNSKKKWSPPKNGWRFNQQRMKDLENDNRLYFTPTTIREKQYLKEREEIGQQLPNIWTDINGNSVKNSIENANYPTQKPEKLLERIINGFTDEKDIVADFFCGSGTTAAVCEKLNRKWICSDLGKFSIHTVRKRMIKVQREQKKNEKNWRAFEILNLGKYQREHFVFDGKSERDDVKIAVKQKKEKEFRELILNAYKAEEISGFLTIHGKKSGSFISIGPVNQSLSRNHVEEVIEECIKNKITSVDILGFEYEMGLFPTIQEEAKLKGLRLTYKQIPMEVFDKRAVSKDEVVFHDVAYIEFKPIFKGKKLSIELIDFAVFYNEDNLNIDEKIPNGKSKLFVENGQIVEKKKDNKGIISEKILTKKWYDWVDYWSVDFDYESKPEIIKFKTLDGKIEEEWTGNYIFENEWQSFREKKDEEKLQLKSSEKEILSGKTKVAVKVVDIFGNDTMKVLQVKI
jgi:adenine specific DNA methylase Mod